MVVYSIMNNLDLLLKITNNKYLLNIYMLFELMISSVIIFYSLTNINYLLLVVGLLVFLPTIYGFWAKKEMIKLMNTIGNKYDYTAAFSSFLIAGLIYYFDLTG